MEYMSIGYILISILLGVIPEALFLTLYLIYVKNIKEKKFILFLLITIVHIIFILFNNYKIITYILFIALVYLILKLLYKNKTQIIDIFVFSISTIYLSILSIIMYPLVKNNYINYYILFIIDRLLLFVPFIFKNGLRKLYMKYCDLWNRNYQKKNPIKSITLRNITLIAINIFIFILNIATISCVYLFQ